MGQAKLEISSDLSALIGKVEELHGSVKGLNQATETYQEKTQKGFYNSQQAAGVLKVGIDKLQSNLKQLTTEYVNLAAVGSKMTAAEYKNWKRVNDEIAKTKDQISTLKQKQADLGVESSKGTGLFKKLGATIAAAFTVGALVSFTKASVAAYQEQLRSESKLKTSLQGRESTINNLIAQAKELQSKTLFNDDEIVNAQALLSIFIKDEKQLKTLTPLVLDFAQAKGMDLASAADLVSKSVGSSTNALTRYGIELTGAAGSSERAKSAVDALSKAFKDQAENALTAEEKALRSMQVSMEQTKEAWGKFTLTLMSTVFADDSSPTGRLTKNLDFRAWELKKMAEDSETLGERIKKNFKWLFTSLRADYDAEQMEKMFNQLAETTVTLKDVAKVKTPNFITPGAANADPYASALETSGYKAYQNLQDLEDKLKELQEKRKTASFDEIGGINSEIERIQAKIAMYDIEKKKIAEKGKDLKTLDDLERERMSAVIEMEIQADIDANAAREKNDEEYKQMRIDRMDWEIEQDAALYDKELKLLLDFQEKAKKAAEELAKFREEHPFAAMFGIENEEQLNQIKDYVGQLTDFANEIIDQQVKASERIVEDQNQRIDEQQALVDNELELKAEGLANSYELEKENLKKMQKARDEAIKDRERMIKIQRIMSTTESGIALVSAAANIIKGFSSIPVVGVVLGLAAVGAMIAGFILATSKAKDAVKMERGGLLEGKRHTQGGIPMEAEDGEFFVNRNSTKKHLPLLEAINRDDRESMKLYFDRKFINKFQGRGTSFDIDKSKKLGEIVREMKKGKADITYGNGFIIERIGGYTKKINLN